MVFGSKIVAKRREEERDRIFSDAPSTVWSRQGSKGFTTLPRTLPVVALIQNALSVGAPVSSTYTDLVFRVFDEQYLVIESPTERALLAGFSGPRAVTTWASRMRALAAMGFIRTQAATKGEFHHTLIVNPFLVVAAIEHSPNGKRIPLTVWEAYHQRCREIGVVLDAPATPPPPPPPPPSFKLVLPAKKST